MSSPLIGSGNALAQAADGLGGRYGSESIAPTALAAYRTVRALSRADDAYKAWQQAGGDLEHLPASLASVSITAGFEHSSSRSVQDSTTPVGTSLRSGGSTTIEAEQGSLHAVGARIAAGVDANGRPTGEPGNVSLTAGQGILLESAQATIDRIFGARSMQAAAGFDPIKGGPAGSAGYASDTGQSHEVRQVDSHVSGTGTVSLTSGGDTSLRGATVTGAQIVASVGGDLTIESRFDTARYRERSVQAQGRFGGSASGSASSGSVRGDSANVVEQSGLIAGAGGYQLTVGGGVNLIGGVISSSADPSRNRLSADHLTFSDLADSTRAMSSSMGFSLGTDGLPLPQVGMAVRQSSSGVARATLSPGTLELRNQQQDLSGLNRDASAANRQAQPYDIERLQARQRSVAALSELMNKGIGTLSKELGLEDGSPAKTVFHAAAGALTALAAGGNVAGGALAGAASELVGAVVNKALADNPNLTQAERNALGQWAAVVVGAVTAGEAGAATALDAERYNRQLHVLEGELIRSNAARYAAERGYCQSADTCSQAAIDRAAGELTLQAIKQTDVTGRTLAQDDAASAFLASIAPQGAIPNLCHAGEANCAQTWFRATGDQYNDASINAVFFGQVAPLYGLASKAFNSEHTNPIDTAGNLFHGAEVAEGTRRTNDAIDRAVLPWEVFNGVFAGAAGPFAIRNGAGEREPSAFERWVAGSSTREAGAPALTTMSGAEGTRPVLNENYLAAGTPVSNRRGMTVIGNDRDTLTVARNVAPEPGYFDLVIHGTNKYDDLGSVFLADGMPTGAGQIAEAIRSNPSWNGEPIRALTCFGGCGTPLSAAQELANILGVPVLGATDIVSVPRYILNSPAQVTNDGKWILFNPSPRSGHP